MEGEHPFLVTLGFIMLLVDLVVQIFAVPKPQTPEAYAEATKAVREARKLIAHLLSKIQ